MKGEVQMTVPELALVLGIRAAFWGGIGLLLANRFSSAENRSAVGRTLLATGLFAGACLGAQIFGRRRSFKLAFGSNEPVVPSESPERVKPAVPLPVS
jgi:hypothetical protein